MSSLGTSSFLLRKFPEIKVLSGDNTCTYIIVLIYKNVLLNFYLCNLFWEGSKIRSMEQETSTPIFATGSNRANLTSFIVGSRTPILCWFLLHNSRIIAISFNELDDR